MSATEDVDHDGVDERIHSYDVVMERFFEMFQIFVVELERFESFFKIFSIYPMTKVRGFLLFFEDIEHILAVFLEKHENDHDYDEDNENQENNERSHFFITSSKYDYTINLVVSIKTIRRIMRWIQRIRQNGNLSHPTRLSRLSV